MTSVVGFDPSLTATGIADDLGYTYTVKPRKATDERLTLIHQAAYRATQGDVDLAVIEDLPTHAMGAGKTGMAQGVVRLACLQHGVPYILVTPATLKKFATGKGNADKAAMREALNNFASIDIKDDNQVDAWWLRALGHELLGSRIVGVPDENLACLSKLTLPQGVAA